MLSELVLLTSLAWQCPGKLCFYPTFPLLLITAGQKGQQCCDFMLSFLVRSDNADAYKIKTEYLCRGNVKYERML